MMQELSSKDIKIILQKFSFEGRNIDLLQSGVIEAWQLKDRILSLVFNVNEYDNVEDIAAKIREQLNVEAPSLEIKVAFTGHKVSNKIKIPGVKKVILVSSGKGGVGKSTMAFLLAQLMSSKGKKVGLLDADIYGPSIPTLTNMFESPDVVDEHIIPHIYNGMKVNSIGYLIPQDKALVWRGPMITKALKQLLLTTHWGELDLLIVDMPPGTGDIHLTLLEKYHIDGVIMVSTPQSLAIADVARAMDMYRKFAVRILGIINNMAYYKAGYERVNVFGDNSAIQKLSERFAVPILEDIPLDPSIMDESRTNCLQRLENILKNLF